ncbi:MAG: putative tellurite resistance protein B-like protein, partial [Psychroserpens sp.]
MTQYNKKRHLELLKKRGEKSISSTESKELLNYSAVLDRQLDWETRDQYLQLLKEFIEGKIDIGEFLIAFEERGRLNGEVLDILESNLILLEPHEK